MPVRGVEQKAFDVIQSINAAGRVDEIFGIVQSVAAEFGLPHFLITGVPMPGQTLSEHVILNGWPQEWMDRYNSKDYVHIDPIANNIRRSSKPFSWSEVVYTKKKHSRGYRIMKEAADFGMAKGYTVPIYGYDGYQACVTMGGPEIVSSKKDLSALHIVSLVAFSAAKELCGQHRQSSQDDFKLSEREIEVIKWISVGKSNWEIGMILGISDKTVEKHVRAASQKLDVANRAHVVAEALRNGLIH